MATYKIKKQAVIGGEFFSTDVAYDLASGLRGEAELWKTKCERLEAALRKAISVIESECDDQELIAELNKTLNP